MGETLGKLFVDPVTLPQDGFGLVQLVFLGGVYGYVLFNASNMISEGSELLLFTPLKAIVGSVVLPVLGAVPDGAIILFSGGTQRELAVGVGALAGSTIMLLTVPWCLAIIAGRVHVVGGLPSYSRDSDGHRCPPGAFYTQFTSTGCLASHSIPRTGWFMLLTMVSYFVVQGPAFRLGCATPGCGCPEGDVACLQSISDRERWWAFTGLVTSVALFFFYLYDQVSGGEDEELRDRQNAEAAERALGSGLLTLRGLASGSGKSLSVRELDIVLFHEFQRYDTDRSGTIDTGELRSLVMSLKETPELAAFIAERADKDKNGVVEWSEFRDCIHDFVRSDSGVAVPHHAKGLTKGPEGGEEEDDEDEEEELPDDLADLTPEEQRSRIWKRSLLLMGLGTVLVLLFSDPMVGILNAAGERTGVSAFYISFLMAPLASNASELIAAYNYALKKTEKTFTIALSSLLGAACMNNTFCLAIFLFQIFSNRLLWEFSAETISIVIVELCMFSFSQQRAHYTWNSLVVLTLLPGSLALVAILEGMGLD
eukprot:Sspe_Gene.54020::Locus_29838_Transcript_1_1_Confidence_1.000_Length_1849::g.54020::m.54020